MKTELEWTRLLMHPRLDEEEGKKEPIFVPSRESEILSLVTETLSVRAAFVSVRSTCLRSKPRECSDQGSDHRLLQNEKYALRIPIFPRPLSIRVNIPPYQAGFTKSSHSIIGELAWWGSNTDKRHVCFISLSQ